MLKKQEVQLYTNAKLAKAFKSVHSRYKFYNTMKTPLPEILENNYVILKTELLRRVKKHKRFNFKMDEAVSVSENVVKAVCSYYNVERSKVLATGRNYAFYRHVIAFIIRKINPELSYSCIARVINRYDHSTVIYAIRKINNREDLRDDIENIMKVLKHHTV